MLRLIVRLGKWLEVRFPEKVVVTQADYTDLLNRVSMVEQNAVHKGAVADLVKAVKAIKDEQDSFKTSMGFTPQKGKVLEAMLNGQFIGEVENE